MRTPDFNQKETPDLAKAQQVIATEQAILAKAHATELATTKGEDGEYRFVPNSFFKELKVLTDENLYELFSIIELLSDKENGINKYTKIIKEIDFFNSTKTDKIRDLFKAFITGNMTYPDKVRFYVFAKYLLKEKQLNEFSEQGFFSWMRVCRNLIENSTIDSIERFEAAIKGIDKLIAGEANYIYNYLIDYDKPVAGFENKQIEEERFKACLIKKNHLWEKELLIAENHGLFRGDIGFLLQDEHLGIADFVSKRMIALKLFNENGNAEQYKENYLLMRSTLSKSDVVLKNYGEIICLIDNASNWKKLINKEFKKPINEIINELINKDSLKFEMETIIKNYSDTRCLWKHVLVKNKILFERSSSISRIIKNYWGTHYLFNKETWKKNDNQFLLSNKRNEIISLFIKRLNLDLHRSSGWWVKKDQITGQSFYRGSSVWLKKAVQTSHLWFHFKENFLVIGFHVDDKNKLVIEENKLEKNDTWLVFKNFGEYPKDNEEIEKWVENVICEIQVIENLAKVKK